MLESYCYPPDEVFHDSTIAETVAPVLIRRYEKKFVLSAEGMMFPQLYAQDIGFR